MKNTEISKLIVYLDQKHRYMENGQSTKKYLQIAIIKHMHAVKPLQYWVNENRLLLLFTGYLKTTKVVPYRNNFCHCTLNAL